MNKTTAISKFSLHFASLAFGIWSSAFAGQAEWPGAKPDGTTLLPNMWSLKPAGRQIPLGDFPANIALHPSGKFAAVLHCGYSAHKIAIVDLKTEAVVANQPVDEAWYGLAFSRDGKKLFVSGSSAEVIYVFDFADGELSGRKSIRLRPEKERGIPAGIALARVGEKAYVANVWGHRVSHVDLKNEKAADIKIGEEISAPAKNFQKPSANPDIAAAEKRQLAALSEQSRDDDPFPYACLLDEKRGQLYVSLWAQSAVAVIDLKSEKTIARWETQEHPTEMTMTGDGKRLFVANANRNTVTVLDPETGRAMETLYAGLRPDLPPGATPNSVALSPDDSLLFIANANVNNVAVFDVSEIGKSRSLGFIPCGWYPTSVRVSIDGRKLFIANGKGGTSFANPYGPQPAPRPKHHPPVQYSGDIMQGTLSVIELPQKRDELEAAMKSWTATALACSPDGSARAPAKLPPVKYCIYVIKENRTYDQILGDMKEGNGHPKLCLFPEKVTPNIHALARDFVLLDNFYVEGEVSADGHEWTCGAYATDFVEKMWPPSYGHNGSGKFPFPAEGHFTVARPSDGYIWDKAAEASVTYRNYAEFCFNTGGPDKPTSTKTKSLFGHFDENYRAFDIGYPDCKRVEHFAEELKKFEAAGDMPRLQITRLGNDHTFGTAKGKLSPTSLIAENDQAVGKFVELISHSKFWPQTAIFVIEDDAQNGPDHVDCHRTEALCISPYTRGRGTDSTMYSTCSMLRTMELILGLKPMSQFDAAATPMTAAFRDPANPAPYVAKPANVPLDEKNSILAWGSRQSGKMNFAVEDAADDIQLNEIIWRSVRGADSKMPAPVRAAFFIAQTKGDDD